MAAVEDPVSTPGLIELQAGARGLSHDAVAPRASHDDEEHGVRDVLPLVLEAEAAMMRDDAVDDGEDHESCCSDASEMSEPSPSFPDMLRANLRTEAVSYLLDVGGAGPRVQCRCELCPFRAFRSDHRDTHLLYHKAPTYTAPCDSQSQDCVIKSMFRFDLVSGVCRPQGAPARNYLRESAALIRKWNADAPPEALRQAAKSNMPYLVFVLTSCGPEYWLRSKTIDCVRVTDRVYYTRGFENLLTGLAVISHGECSGVVDRLYQKCSENGISPFLLGHGKNFIPIILRQVFLDPEGVVQATHMVMDGYVHQQVCFPGRILTGRTKSQNVGRDKKVSDAGRNPSRGRSTSSPGDGMGVIFYAVLLVTIRH
jgi:hypothetical protein